MPYGRFRQYARVTPVHLSATMQTIMTAFIVFFLVLTVLVLIHELGHYIAARISGVKAEEFGFGFPPRALGFTRVNGSWKKVSGRDRSKYPNTIWSLNYLPLGGFVRLKGESGENASDDDSFLKKNGWQKFFILSAGVLMNWLLAAVIFSGGLMAGIPADLDHAPAGAQISEEHIEIAYILEGSGADEAGLLAGDRLLSIQEQVPSDVAGAKELLSTDAEGETAAFSILREDEQIEVTASSKYIEELDGPGFGIVLARVGIVRFSPPRAIVQGVILTGDYTYRIVVGFGTLVRDLIIRKPIEAEIAGPVGIAVLTGEIAEDGFWALMQFTALLSINLAVINFLPIPALDGGRVVFVLVEGLRRRRNNPNFEAAIHQIGFVALLVLILLVTINDIQRYGSSIWNGLLSVVGLK